MAATVPEFAESAGGEPVLQLPDSNVVSWTFAEPTAGISQLPVGAVSAVWRIVRARRSRRGRAVPFRGVEGPEGLQQGVQFPGFVRVYSRTYPDQHAYRSLRVPY